MMGKKREREGKIPEQYQKKRTPGKYLNAKRRERKKKRRYICIYVCRTSPLHNIYKRRKEEREKRYISESHYNIRND